MGEIATPEAESGDPACWSAGVEEEIALTNGVLADVVRQLSDAVVICSASGDIVFWNTAAATIFGWTADEAIGRGLDIIIPERFRARHWKSWQRVMDSGHTEYGDRLLEVPATHKDGSTISIGFTVTLISREPMRLPQLVVAVVRDQTEAWAERKGLRSEIAHLRSMVDS